MKKKKNQEKEFTIVEVKNLSKIFQKKTKLPGIKGFFKPMVDDF